ncbi:MAG TPA: hypothetical protein VD861_00105 [Pyrinomonadaceae bacterium]|nr:hypothetical protein [Pyrinomonadaceae bacterium]
MEHYLGVAREEGVTDDEIGAVQSIVMAVSAGRVEAQFREARTRGRGNSGGEEEGARER